MVALAQWIKAKEPDVVAENRVWSFLGESPDRVRQTAVQVADCDWEKGLVDYDWRRGPSLAQSAQGDVRNYEVTSIDVGTWNGKTGEEFLKEIGLPAAVIAGLAVAGSAPTGTAGAKTIAEGAAQGAAAVTSMVLSEASNAPGPADAVKGMTEIVRYKWKERETLRITNNLEIRVISKGEVFVEDKFLWFDGWTEQSKTYLHDAGHKGTPQLSDIASALAAAKLGFPK